MDDSPQVSSRGPERDGWRVEWLHIKMEFGQIPSEVNYRKRLSNTFYVGDIFLCIFSVWIVLIIINI